MSRCIVCGLNDTSGSRHAASIASRLARDLDSRAVLVQVREGESRLQRLSPLAPGRSRRLRRGLRLTAEEHCFPPGTDLRVATGHAASTLVAIADREDAELLVVGAGGLSAVSPTLLGSVASTLMTEAPCPVVVVPAATVAPLDAEGMRSVVCGLSEDERDVAVLRLAADLAARLGGHLQVVQAYEDADAHDAEHRVADTLESAGVDADAIIAPGPPADALREVADQHHASLIVVGSGTGTIPPSNALGAVPTQLAAAGRLAVVVVPSGAVLDQGSGHYELAAKSA
jgi:nucleotide-binding universal stress UspA family protein